MEVRQSVLPSKEVFFLCAVLHQHRRSDYFATFRPHNCTHAGGGPPCFAPPRNDLESNWWCGVNETPLATPVKHNHLQRVLPPASYCAGSIMIEKSNYGDWQVRGSQIIHRRTTTGTSYWTSVQTTTRHPPRNRRTRIRAIRSDLFSH